MVAVWVPPVANVRQKVRDMHKDGYILLMLSGACCANHCSHDLARVGYFQR
jgi:hypothetical protein